MSGKVGEGFLKEISDFPQMLGEGLSFGKRLKKIKKPGAVFIAGMGGSAIGGDMVAALFKEKISIPITVVRNYILPAYARKNDFLICVSYSGNTEETLEVFGSAKKRGLNLACITSGGKLRKLAEQYDSPFIILPGGIQPRSALPYLLIALLKILEKAQIVSSQKKYISQAVKLLCSRKKEFTTKAKQLAQKLQDKIPLIFASAGITEAAGYRLKCQFNENSKVTAHLSLFPELNHNEIVNLSYLKKGAHKFFLLILRDKEEHGRIKKRIKITRSLISKDLGKIYELESIGESRLSRMLSLIFFGDLLTTYLAILKKRDPADVGVIERLKEALKK